MWIGGKTWKRTAGSADLKTKAPFRPADHVRIASITKSFTATATLQLVDKKQLKLEDTLERFVPGITNGAKITIKDLLGMTSGIFDFTTDQPFVDRFVANPTLPWSAADTVKIIKAHQPLFAPGAEVSYCDSNYVLLGMIIEQVTGKTAGEVITTEIIDKLSMSKTSYPTGFKIPQPHPTGYLPGGDTSDPNAPFDNAKNPPTASNDVNPAVASTAGAMISNLNDLRTWGTEIATGSLLEPATQALRLEARPFPGQQINIGYGLGCEKLNDFVGHNGAIIGFSSVVMRNDKADVTIAAVANESTNSTTPTSTFAYAVVKELYPDQWK